jgi:hypothetical protein
MSDVDLLTKRVSFLEQDVEGEKLVTRHILEQTRRNADDLAAIEGRLGRIATQLGEFAVRFDRSDAELRALRRDLPGLIAETLRDLLRERD